MLLVKKCQFLHYLFLLKLRLETRFNNVPDRKETFSDCKKKKFLTSQKSNFSKGGQPIVLVKKCQFFHYLFLLKIRLEIRFKNVLDRKETSFDYRKK